MASSVTVIRQGQCGPKVDVDPGRVISSAILMAFMLITNFSSVKMWGHVSYRFGGLELRPPERGVRGGGGA